MLVRGVGSRDIAEISCDKVLSVLTKSEHIITPKQSYYSCLEVDEFWTYAGKKANKVWLIYAYDRQSGEIVGFVWGKRDLKTAMELKKKLLDSGVTYGSITTDEWDTSTMFSNHSFVAVFKDDNHLIGKEYTVGIEGNNCRLRHRIRRAFRTTCCF
jgi:IS1 family transposase